MFRTTFVLSILVLTGTLVVNGGCSTQQGDLAPVANAPADNSREGSPDAAGAKPKPDPAVDPETERALAALSTEDRALASRQRVCPVSEEPLGSMGTPVKVHVRDRDVLLCCKGCDEEIQANPDKYLAKLPD